MSYSKIGIIYAFIMAIVSCTAIEQKESQEEQAPIFPATEFARFLPFDQQNLSWKIITNISGSVVWESSNQHYLAITRNGKAITLIKPEKTYTTYHLFGSSDKVLEYKVNGRDVENAIIDFIYNSK